MGLDMYFYKKRRDQKSSSEEVGYLRKANAIHGYIVDNFASGVDECQKIVLKEEDINKLYDTILEVLYKTTLKKGKVKNGYTFNADGSKKYFLEDGYIFTKKSIEIASELLPTCAGFFFGSVEYDEYYYKKLFETLNICKDLLEVDFNEYEVYYQASW